MKKIISLLILCLLLFNGITQSKFPVEKFGFNSELQNLESKTNVGFFVKGNKYNVQSLCETYSGKYISTIKGWHYIRLSPSNIIDFTNEKDITQHYIPLEIGEPHNDTMRVNNKINDAHNGISPLPSGYTGKDVIIGFIDTEIDYDNPDFKNPDGSTRIISLWDQTLTGTSTIYGYGVDWDSTEINAGAVSGHNKLSSHGTTVAGAGAGNGLNNGKNKGVAYESDIIFVALDFGTNFLSNVQDATEYIYRIADSIGKPCVINASAGTSFGSHDGLDPNAQYIDSLITSSSGHLFVSSAGNNGGNDFHLQHNSTINDTIFTLFKHNPSLNYAPYGCVPYCYGSNSVHFTAYADVSNFNSVKIAMSAYHGSHKSGTSSFFTIADYLSGSLYQDNYGAYVDSIVNGNNQRIGLQFMFATLLYDSVYQFEIIVSPDSITNYLWGLETTGGGKCDIWSDEATYSKSDMISSSDTEFPFASKPSNYVDPDTLQNMCSSFQCSPNVITVANYVNESGYVNNLGVWVNESGIRGEIATSSSTGPTRINLQKPDLAASGQTTVSTYPGYLLSYRTDAELGEGGLHYRNGGTSMASPVVAGVGALYLEKCHLATSAKFKTDLINSVYTDSWVGSTPNYSFGYGKLDGFATLVNSISNDTTTIISCNNYIWKSTTYDSTGLYYDTTTNSFGCDSISVLDLTINNSYNDTIQISACNSYTWDASTYSSNGLYTNTYTTIAGCDSIVTLDLTINSSLSSNDIQQSCNNFTWIDGVTYTSSNNLATHTLTSSGGCDSIITLDLTIFNNDSVIDTQQACGSLTWIDGITYSTSNNIATYTLINVNGCDSIATLNLTINSSSNDTSIINSCDSYNWNGNTYINSGTFIDTLTNTSGCDSIVTLILSLNYSNYDTTIIASCDSYNWNGQDYFSSGFYADSLNTIHGCDSVLYLDLTINNSFLDTLFITECDSYFWNNTTYDTSGFYANSGTTISGCDSIHYLNLTINNSTNDTIKISACDTLFWNSNSYTSSGFYTGSFLTANGCDSIVTVDLQINGNEGTPLEFKLILDDYCMETYWTVKDSDDSTLYNLGPYDCNPNGGGTQANDTIITDIYLPINDCYTLTLFDYYNDGLSASNWGGTDGSWVITEKNGNILSQGSGNFGSSISIDFYVTSAIPSGLQNNVLYNTIYAFPNPFNERTTINIKGLNPPFNVDLIDISGRIAKSLNINTTTFELVNTNFETGIYWLILKSHPNASPIKLIIQ
ncbi:MAG: S8 family peptidase [Flavobacteriales bacterium]|nr:S8 family peptidase [Flavobacteriales bacterium]